ncbi:MAG: hypothetical protein BAJATHORv1_30061 [Candidatus Thorarchaeota archaeon]|nr:MAG: hypothetical protein BAJATHORv1_30061 [Candidatus Thorarchaeota archaeon]
MGTVWFIAKEYLKRLEVDFEEHGRKTFSLYPFGQTKTEQIEIFPGTHWITLTTRLQDISDLPEDTKQDFCQILLKANAKLAEVSFGIDKKDCVIIRNAIPVVGISYDSFNATYEAHKNGVKFYQKSLAQKVESK